MSGGTPATANKEIDLTTCQLSIFPHYRLPTRILDVPATTEDGCLNNDRMARLPFWLSMACKWARPIYGILPSKRRCHSIWFCSRCERVGGIACARFQVFALQQSHSCLYSYLSKVFQENYRRKNAIVEREETPGCRHNFWRIVALKVKQGIDTVIHRIRRRGKDLVFFSLHCHNQLTKWVRTRPGHPKHAVQISNKRRHPSHLQMQFRFPIYGTGGPRGNRRGHKVFRPAAGGLLPYFHPKLAHATLEKSGSINSRFARGCSQLRLLHHKIPK